MSYDYVNPSHYTGKPIEVIEMMVRVWGPEAVSLYCDINAFKYRMRMGEKPNQPIEQELAKARWYEQKSKELRDAINVESAKAQKDQSDSQPTNDEVGDIQKRWSEDVA